MKGSRLFLFGLIMSMGTTAFGDYSMDGRRDERSPGIRFHDPDASFGLIRRLDSVRQLLEQNARNLTRDQAFRINQLLTQVEQVAGDSSGGYTPGPNPAPYPRWRRCADEDLSVMSNAFSKLKNFAYSGSGLNYMSDQATQYAQAWVQEHGCAEADNWVSEGYKIRNFAYSGNGLNMMSSGAADYTKQMLPRRCYDNVDYVSEGAKIYNFAYSGAGLNMSSSQASEYTRQKMEEKFFSCNGQFFGR